MTENEAKLFNNLMEHNSAYYGYELSKGETKTVLQAFEQLKQYRAIGTVEEFKALKEKGEPKKIKGTRFAEAICPKCESELFETYWAFGGIHYCSNCGQAIDWQ